MPRDRSRSRSRSPDRKRERDSKRKRRDRDRDRSRSRSRSRSRDRRDRYGDEDKEDRGRKEEQTIGSLQEVGQRELTMDDYFLKAAEFKAWLREEKGKYLDDLSGDKSRKYFKKFISRWNDLVLPPKYYRPLASTSVAASAQTGYKWSFANNRSKVDKNELERLRGDVDKMTNGGDGVGSMSSSKAAIGPSLPSSGRTIGPSMPSTALSFSASSTLSNTQTPADRQLALEEAREEALKARKAERNKLYGRVEELVPKAGGREGKMEERRATNAENRMYREKDASAGIEVDEATLMGGGNDFQKALAQREAARARKQDRRSDVVNDRRAAMSDRLQSMKAKDDETMAMFRQMAQSKFGQGGR